MLVRYSLVRTVIVGDRHAIGKAAVMVSGLGDVIVRLGTDDVGGGSRLITGV